MELAWLAEGIVVLAAAGLVLIAVIAHITAGKLPNINEYKKLLLNGNKESVPNLHDPAVCELSIVVPSYNEEERLPSMMNEALDYLEDRQKQDPSFTYEVIVVDDGSRDQTTKVAQNYIKKYGDDKVRVLTLVRNRGKGGAVRMGVFSSRGKRILIADADGATKFKDIEKVEKGLESLQPWPEMMAISCGSRAHLEKDSIVQRSYFRTFLMHGFHYLVRFLCVKDIRDTQCGFKLLTREAACRTFSALHIERWAFDVELLYIAQCFKIPIAEIAVNWTEIEESDPQRLLSGLCALFFLLLRTFQSTDPSNKNSFCTAQGRIYISRKARCITSPHNSASFTVSESDFSSIFFFLCSKLLLKLTEP